MSGCSEIKMMYHISALRSATSENIPCVYLTREQWHMFLAVTAVTTSPTRAAAEEEASLASVARICPPFLLIIGKQRFSPVAAMFGEPTRSTLEKKRSVHFETDRQEEPL